MMGLAALATESIFVSDWRAFFFGKPFWCDDIDSISVKAHLGYAHMYVTNFKNVHKYTHPY